MTLLQKQKWKELDALLSKTGFGGYYDLLECLKSAITNIIEYFPFKDPMKEDFREELRGEKDLETVVQLLNAITNRLSEFEET